MSFFFVFVSFCWSFVFVFGVCAFLGGCVLHVSCSVLNFVFRLLFFVSLDRKMLTFVV